MQIRQGKGTSVYFFKITFSSKYSLCQSGIIQDGTVYYLLMEGVGRYLLKGPKFCHPKTAFWNIDFKQVIKKQKTQKEHLTLPASCLREGNSGRLASA